MAKGSSLFRVKNRKEGAKALQSPIEVLHILANLAQNESYVFRRVYRNLYNPEFYWYAYKNLYADNGRLGDFYGGTSIGILTEQRISGIIESLRDGSYQPSAPDGSGEQTGNDRLVQEVIRLLLEAIYEPVFSSRSHGFRPDLSAQTALFDVKKLFTGVTWLGKGSISYEGLEPDVVFTLLKRRINDEPFLRLVRKFMKSGYGKTWSYGKTYSGVPLGAGLGPILLTITLHELDQFMEEYANRFSKGSKRKVNPEYDRAAKRASYYRRMDRAKWDQLSQEEKEKRCRQLKKLESEERKLPSKLPMDSSYKRIQYIRYAGEILIGVCGSKADTEQALAGIEQFLQDRLHLALRNKVIAHSSDKIRYLGYDISVSRCQETKKRSDGAVCREYAGSVRLLVPREVWVQTLFACDAAKVRITEDGKEKYVAVHRGELVNHSNQKILIRYCLEIHSLYTYYALAVNSFRIGIFANLMKYSMYKTFACKYKTNVHEIKRRYCVNGVFTVTEGGKTYSFYQGGFARRILPYSNDTISELPEFSGYSLKDRVARHVCECCGKDSQDLEIFQVERISDLKGNTSWRKMMRRKNQRTLVVCLECLAKIRL